MQQLQRLESQLRSDALDTSERQIALSTLQTTHVGAMDTDEVSERLLTEPSLLAISAQVQPEDSLEVAFHIADAPRLLLDSLHTYE